MAEIASRHPALLDGAAVRAALRDRIAGYKLPRAVAFCAQDELPIGSSGKALRRSARTAFADRLVRIDERP